MMPFNAAPAPRAREDVYGPRNSPRVRIRVHVRPQLKQMFGQLWPNGVSEQVIYRDQLDAVRKLCWTSETHALMKTAEQAHEHAKTRWISEKRGNRRDLDPAFLAELERRYPGSVEAQFSRIAGRSVPPFISVEEVEAVSPPDTPESQAHQQMNYLAEAFARAMSMLKDSESAPRRGRPPKDPDPIGG